MQRQSRPSYRRSPTASRASRKRVRFFFVVLAIVAVFAINKIWDQQQIVNAKKEQLAELERRLAEVQADHEAYRQEIRRLNDPEYIEQLLRKELYMTKDGEKIFIETE